MVLVHLTKYERNNDAINGEGNPGVGNGPSNMGVYANWLKRRGCKPRS